jgi:hypothetical protein
MHTSANPEQVPNKNKLLEHRNNNTHNQPPVHDKKWDDRRVAATLLLFVYEGSFRRFPKIKSIYQLCQSGVKNISAIPLTEMHQFIFNSEKRRRVQLSP